MSSAKRVTALTLIVLLVLLVVVFILENNQPATLTFFGWSTPQLPFAVYVVMALLLGWGAGPVMSWVIGTGVKRRGKGGDVVK
ncbi:LapA family protein [Pseudomonas sp. XS1P51]